MKQSVYIVDDDSLLRRWATAFLNGAGYSVRPFANGNDFIDSLAELPRGCVVLDMHMPGLDGLETLERLRAAGRNDIACIMASGVSDLNTAVRAMKLGATDFLEKPVREQQLLELITQTFAKLDQQYASGE